MAATDAKPVPQKNVAYRVTFPILDADGDLVTGATGLDSEVSQDGGAFADCTNEATEIATSSGVYYLDLTSTEMNADTVAVIIKTSSSGAKTTTIVMYPEEAGDIRVNVTAFGGTAGTFSSGRPDVNTTHIAGSAVSTSSAQLGVNVVNLGGSAVSATSGLIDANVTQISGDSVAADNLESYTDGTTPMPVNATQISGDSTAADNLEAALDGTGGVTITAALTGNITGNITGDIAGDITGGITGDITGNLSGSVGSVAGNVGGNVVGTVASVVGNIGGNVTGSVGSLATQAKADVNAEVVDALNVDTYAEPGQGTPAATASLASKLGYLYKAWRNKITQTSTEYKLYADDGTTVDQKTTASDDGSTFTKNEIGTGP